MGTFPTKSEMWLSLEKKKPPHCEEPLSLGAQHWVIPALGGGFLDESPAPSHEELDRIFGLSFKKTVSQYMWSKETVIHTLQFLVHQILWVTRVPCSSEHNFCSLVHSGSQFLQELEAWACCFHIEKTGSVEHSFYVFEITLEVRGKINERNKYLENRKWGKERKQVSTEGHWFSSTTAQ